MKVSLTGADVRRLMRQHKVTIRGLAGRMGITQKRVRYVRSNGIRGIGFVRDWREGITGEAG